MRCGACGWPGFLGYALAAALAVALAIGSVRAQSQEAKALGEQISKLAAADKYAEALALQRKLADMVERSETAVTGKPGPQTVNTLSTAAWYALFTHDFAGALVAAERAHALQPTNLFVETNRAHALLFLGQLAQARALYLSYKGKPINQIDDKLWEEAIAEDFAAFRKSGLVVSEFVGVLTSLGMTKDRKAIDLETQFDELKQLLKTGRYSEAAQLAERAENITRQRLGEDHNQYATALSLLATSYQFLGKLGDAEVLFQRALTIYEKALGKEHPFVATSLNNLAGLYQAQGKLGAAEPLYQRALEVKGLGPEHQARAQALNDLGVLYRDQGKYTVAEPLLQRAIAIYKKTLGPEHPFGAAPLNNLALLYQLQGKLGPAEALYGRSLAIDEKILGPDHPDVATGLINLATLLREQGKLKEAQLQYHRALAIAEKALGGEHLLVATTLNNLAELNEARGNVGAAAALYQRSLLIRQKALGPNHHDVAMSLSNLATLYFTQKNWSQAAAYWTQSTEILKRRGRLGAASTGDRPTGTGKNEAVRNSPLFWALVKATYHLAKIKRSTVADAASQMFETAQWAQSSEAGAALAQMAARGAQGDPRLASAVRERQDLLGEWQSRDAARTAAASQPPDKRNPEADASNVARVGAIETRIADIDKRLAAEFSNYAALAAPDPVSIADVRGSLRSDEALILILDTPKVGPTPEETFVWVATKSEIRWVRSDLGTASLQREVAALRCGLDYEGSWAIKDSPCPALTKTSYTENDHRTGKPLPFDLTRTYVLYTSLFGEVEDLIKDKHLLIVPSGALTQLPFQVLMTAPPDASVMGAEAFRNARWLIKDHAITVLPSVASLKALRRDVKPSRASKPMIGFGNPLLDGMGPAEARRAAQARANTACPVKPIEFASLRRAITPLDLRGGFADVAFLRSAPPLPETADELCAVAADLKVGNGDIYLGARATVPQVTRLSASGELSRYRMIHFATHGALSGQVSGSAEPGLILTPPKTASDADDGYLSASRIAALKLDADWVILSACNTAAGGSKDAEALSGLARAFFYAGARALLVSHWSVNSDATVKLISGAVDRLAADKAMGRAEALRQSMLTLMSTGTDYEAQPANWAPFVVVGEGAVAK